MASALHFATAVAAAASVSSSSAPSLPSVPTVVSNPAVFIKWPKIRTPAPATLVAAVPQLMFRSMAVLILNSVAGGARPVPELDHGEVNLETEKKDSSLSSSSEDEDGSDEDEEVKIEEKAEELESLEEAVMTGGDEGRAPDDYGRRAEIFDESSKVFTTLKERNHDESSNHV